MSHTLSTEELKQRFGDIRLEIISHKGNIRTSCVRRLLDNAALAYSVVVFHAEGVSAFGDEFHRQILFGETLGEAIKDSGMPHERVVSEQFSSKTNFGLAFLFDTKESICASRTVDYKIKNAPYASITEFYNPEFIPVGEGITELREDAPISKEGWFLIGELQAGFEEEYLRLAHGFLKKPMHIGIEDRSIFVEETRQTLELLLKDPNTKLFVAVDSKQFIGYVALNIHPALHINGLECIVRELYVKEEYQGKGIGTVLMDYAERYARTRGCKRMSLATKWDDEKQKPRGFRVASRSSQLEPHAAFVFHPTQWIECLNICPIGYNFRHEENADGNERTLSPDAQSHSSDTGGERHDKRCACCTKDFDAFEET